MSAQAEARLVRAIVRAAGAARVAEAHSREWRSATFAGAHHRVSLLAAPDTGRRIARLSPDALVLPGAIVADLAVVASVPAGADVRLTLEALTVASG